MKLQLVPNARRVLLRAWSAWLGLVSMLLGSAEFYHSQLIQLLPILQPYLKPGTALLLSMMVGAMVPVARIIKQAQLDAGRVADESASTRGK